jgi:hypothetical protein
MDFGVQLVKKYVSIEYDDETQSNLRQRCNENGFDLTWKFNGERQAVEDYNFHTIIFYTKSLHAPGSIYEPVYGENRATMWELLGKDKEIPTVRVFGPELMKLRRKFYDKGYRDEWPKYRPHISISYSPIVPVVNTIPLPAFPLRFDRLKIKDLIE